jgi:hypothetical protein
MVKNNTSQAKSLKENKILPNKTVKPSENDSESKIVNEKDSIISLEKRENTKNVKTALKKNKVKSLSKPSKNSSILKKNPKNKSVKQDDIFLKNLK